MIKHRIILTLAILFIILEEGLSGTGDISWMTEGKYGIFIHYQYRILLNYSIRTDPIMPSMSQMTAKESNRFVDGFDVKGFADQIAEAKMGWVLFCIDDHFFGWQCAPNKTFCEYTGYASGEKCSHRDLIMDVADALKPKNIKFICYFARLNGNNKESRISSGLKDSIPRGFYNEETPPSVESRKRRLAILREYADRYRDKIVGRWFYGIRLNTYNGGPDDWRKINSIVHKSQSQSCYCVQLWQE